MVGEFGPPERPLSGGRLWRWQPDGRALVRIWHMSAERPVATSLRDAGPLARFDHHRASGERGAERRAVTYLAGSLRTAAAEVFGGSRLAAVCPAWRVSTLRPLATATLLNLRGTGALRIGALPALGSGPVPRTLSQAWARAIYEDLGVDGVRYTGAHEEGVCVALWERAPQLVVARDGDGLAREDRLQQPAVWRALVAALDAVAIGALPIDHGGCELCAAGR